MYDVRVLLLIRVCESECLLVEHLAAFELISLLYQKADTADIADENMEPDPMIISLLQARHLFCELQQQRQALARETASKSQFISTVVHEFRNPVSIISSLTQLMLINEERLSVEQRNMMLERTMTAVEKLTELIDGLLAFERNASVYGKFSPKKVDLEGCCLAILNDLNLINKGMYEISFRVKGDCSNLFVDPSLINTILTNLIANALKYSPDDSPVSLLLEHQTGQIVIEVSDHGQGIPVEDQDSLFDAFFRARNVGTIEGIGLGLSIVKQCVELHHGTIGFQSEIGRGTTFIVILPLVALQPLELPSSSLAIST